MDNNLIDLKPQDKCCDGCINYEWYYDHCKKFNCEVDSRSVCSLYDSRDKYNEQEGI